jgi:hypothetical protein
VSSTDKIFFIHFASEESITIDENSFSNTEIGKVSPAESYMAEVSVVLAKSTELGITEGRCNNYMSSNDITEGRCNNYMFSNGITEGRCNNYMFSNDFTEGCCNNYMFSNDITEGRCNNYMFSNDIARGASIIKCLVMTPRGTLQ